MDLLSENFQTEGLGGGFPFFTKQKSNFIRTQPLTSGNFPGLPVTVNHYWNLASVDFNAEIKTEDRPAGYENSYFNTSQDSDVDGYNDFSVSYKVYNPHDQTDLRPIHRIAIDETGQETSVSLNNRFKIQGDGEDKTSCYVAKEENGYVGFYQPLTIQPKNTGVFVITLDLDVARYFENIVGFSSIQSFEINHKINIGSGVAEVSEGGQKLSKNDDVYMDFPTSGYLVPREGWSFKIQNSKITNNYYHYG